MDPITCTECGRIVWPQHVTNGVCALCVPPVPAAVTPAQEADQLIGIGALTAEDVVQAEPPAGVDPE